MAWIPLSSVLGEYSFSLMKLKRLMALESKGPIQQKGAGLKRNLLQEELELEAVSEAQQSLMSG
jgi:hypothetical protein